MAAVLVGWLLTGLLTSSNLRRPIVDGAARRFTLSEEMPCTILTLAK